MLKNKKPINIKSVIFLAIFCLFLFPNLTFASTGTIDSTNRYAWSENAGWIDFGATQGNVQITDSELTGYAYSPKIGWISLNCKNDNSCATVNYQVGNDEYGNLFGYAYSENAGWINFRPQGTSGVVIDTSGNFSGYAYSPKVGWIVFNCITTNTCDTVNYKVSTDYKPPVKPSGFGGYDPGLFDKSVIIQKPTTLPILQPQPTVKPIFQTTPNDSQTKIQNILDQINNLKLQLQNQQTQSVNVFTKTLKYGSSGNQVILLQDKLKQLGFFSKEIKSNGYFGKATLKAVQDFQTAHNIVSPKFYGYGIVGPKTREVLNNLK